MSDKLLEAIGGISEQFIAECDDYISQRKASHRRRKLTRVAALCAAVIARAALLTGAVYSIFRAGSVIGKSEKAQGGWAQMDIKLTGETVGSADYSTFELYDGVERSDPNFYRMVYNQLMLSAQANWDNDYTAVKQDETSENAVTKIGIVADYGSGSPGETTYQPGILAFSTEFCVYVNISLESGIFTDEQIEYIARSIELTR